MKIRNESGIALITALLILILMGALLVTFFVRLDSSQRMIGMGQDSDRAFAGAYAALERLKNGTYGYSVISGEEIGLRRLMARPVATTTQAEREEYEK